MTILIVDDHAPVRRVIRDTIEDLTGEIFECADGREAVLSYSEHRPDWVFMDIEMPGGDGLTATRDITAEFPEANVIIVSTNDSARLRQIAASAGARAYVSKENLFELRRMVKP